MVGGSPMRAVVPSPPDITADDSLPFTPVVRRKKRRKRDAIHGSVPSLPADLVARTMAELRADSEWRQTCCNIVQRAADAFALTIENVLCLGLGSPTESTQARFQLCLLLELRSLVFPPETPIYAFDPVFSPQDMTLLTSFGVQLILEDMHGKHVLTGPTLAYMPHCERNLYEGFLRANWSAAQLANLLLIGNELCQYTESIPSHIMRAESPCITRIAPLMTSAPLPEHARFPNALSSTAVQYVSRSVRKAESDGENASRVSGLDDLLPPAFRDVVVSDSKGAVGSRIGK